MEASNKGPGGRGQKQACILILSLLAKAGFDGEYEWVLAETFVLLLR